MSRVYETTLVRRRQIVDACRKLIARYGSEHVTVRRIAREIGVSEGNIYRHFKSKRDILSFLVDDIEDTLVADIENIGSQDSSALESLERIMASHISSIEQRKGVSFQIIAEIVSLGDKKLDRKVYDVINEYLSRIRDILSAGIEAGQLRKDIDIDAAATLFFGMIQGMVNVWALSHNSFDLSQKYSQLWEVFREAIVNR